MRSSLLAVVAVVSMAGAGCARHERAATVTALGDTTHSLSDDVVALPLSRGELAVLRRPPTLALAEDLAGLGAQTRTAARWDTYLAGDTAVLTAAERRGLVLFTRVGCASCHDGLFLGGDKYRRLGEALPVVTLADSGRYQAIRYPAGLYAYRVTSLRNVQLRHPYLHDGSAKGLGQAVRLMSRHQLGVDLTEDQVRDICEYLATLTGRLPSVIADAGPAGGR